MGGVYDKSIVGEWMGGVYDKSIVGIVLHNVTFLSLRNHGVTALKQVSYLDSIRAVVTSNHCTLLGATLNKYSLEDIKETDSHLIRYHKVYISLGQ